MAVTWADVVALDAALANVPVPAQDLILADAYATLPVGRWGAKLDMGVRYYAAHFGALELRGAGLGAVGPLVSERLGDAAQAYGDPTRRTGQATTFDLTVWGRHFQFLVRGLAFGGVAGSALAIPPIDFWNRG